MAAVGRRSAASAIHSEGWCCIPGSHGSEPAVDPVSPRGLYILHEADYSSRGIMILAHLMGWGHDNGSRGWVPLAEGFMASRCNLVSGRMITTIKSAPRRWLTGGHRNGETYKFMEVGSE